MAPICINSFHRIYILPEQSELRLINDFIPRLRISELKDGHRLIVRNGGEILIPKSARAEIIKTLHLTHPATETMLTQCRNNIFWPKMRQEIEQ